MFRNIKLGFVGSLASLVLAVACGSSSGGSGTPPGTYCDEQVAGAEICFGYTNLTADQSDSLNKSCASGGFKSVSSCPGGDIGCCAFTTAGYNVNECYYQGDPSTYEQACKGQSGAVWTAGSGGDGGGSSSGSSSGGGDGGKGGDSGGKGDAGMCAKGTTACGTMGACCTAKQTCKSGKCM